MKSSVLAYTGLSCFLFSRVFRIYKLICFACCTTKHTTPMHWKRQMTENWASSSLMIMASLAKMTGN